MEGLNILFASDMHGNKIQYNKLFDYAAKNSFDLLILGGDITPKDAVNRTPQKQEEFLEKYLFKKNPKILYQTGPSTDKSSPVDAEIYALTGIE